MSLGQSSTPNIAERGAYRFQGCSELCLTIAETRSNFAIGCSDRLLQQRQTAWLLRIATQNQFQLIQHIHQIPAPHTNYPPSTHLEPKAHRLKSRIIGCNLWLAAVVSSFSRSLGL